MKDELFFKKQLQLQQLDGMGVGDGGTIGVVDPILTLIAFHFPHVVSVDDVLALSPWTAGS